MKKSFVIAGLIIFISMLHIFLFNLPAAHAVDRYVSSANGEDKTIFPPSTNNCDGIKKVPCKTIQHAIKQSKSGDRIKVDTSGIYNENISMTPALALTLDIQGGWNTRFSSRNLEVKSIIRAGLGSVISIEAGAIDIDIGISGFILTNGDAQDGGGVYVYSIFAGTKTIHLENNIITANHASDNGGGIFVFNHTSTLDLTLTKNIITNNQAGGVHGGGIGVYVVFPDATVALTNNIIAGNSGGIGGGVELLATGAGTLLLNLTNNTITGNNAQYGGGLAISSITNASATLDLTNSIIWGNTASNSGGDVYIEETDQFGDATTLVDARYSDLGDVQIVGGTYNDNGGNIDENPRIASPTTGDYHLRYASPCKDAAICGAWKRIPRPFPDPPIYVYNRIAPVDDFEGDLRPGWGSITGCDIGADEFIGNAPAMPWVPLLLLAY